MKFRNALKYAAPVAAALALPGVSQAAAVTFDVTDVTGTISNGTTAMLTIAGLVLAVAVAVKIYKKISGAA